MTLNEWRKILEAAYSDDTRAPGFPVRTPSGGHCAVVALLTQQRFGGELVSAKVNGMSHWFNRIDGKDVDVTADQFGFLPWEEYKDIRVRSIEDVNVETWRRAHKLACRIR